MRNIIDPGIKESILGDLRIANALINEGRSNLGLQVLAIAIRRTREAMQR